MKRVGFIVLGLCTFGLLIAVGCKGGAMKSGETLAIVNGEKITQGDIDMMLETLPPRARTFYQTPQAKKQILDSMVTNELLYQAAVKRGIDRKPAVEHQVENAKRSVYAKFLLDQVTEERTNDEAVKKKFDTDKDTYGKPEVKASHILVKEEKLAKDIAKRAKKGEDFAKLAEKYSEDPSNKTRGGDLGWFSADRMVPPFSEAAFKLKKGEISEPVKTQFGWHVIKLDDRRESQPFDDVKERVKADLTRTVRTDFINELKSGAKIEITMKEDASAPPPIPGMPGGMPGAPGQAPAPRGAPPAGHPANHDDHKH